MGVKIKVKGDYNNTLSFLNRLHKTKFDKQLIQYYAEKGVEALKAATPKDTGKTADSWYYEIKYDRDKATIYWCNSNENKGANIAMLIQYGHGTRTGAYVQGIDYINPVIKPLFEEMANSCWKEVTNA